MVASKEGVTWRFPVKQENTAILGNRFQEYESAGELAVKLGLKLLSFQASTLTLRSCFPLALLPQEVRCMKEFQRNLDFCCHLPENWLIILSLLGLLFILLWWFPCSPFWFWGKSWSCYGLSSQLWPDLHVLWSGGWPTLSARWARRSIQRAAVWIPGLHEGRGHCSHSDRLHKERCIVPSSCWENGGYFLGVSHRTLCRLFYCL